VNQQLNMVKKMKKIFLNISILATVILFSCTQKPATGSIDLNSWKFKTGDDLAWAQPGFDDSSWKPIAVGHPWEPQGYKKYDGYAWYHIRFNLPSTLRKSSMFRDSLRVILGRIDDHDQSFLNGKLLGQNARLISAANSNQVPEDLSKTPMEWEAIRNYTVPVSDPRLLWDKENVIAIRVFDQAYEGGLCTVPVTVRMPSLTDYMSFESPSKLLDIAPDGNVSKTVTLKNLSTLPRLKGTLTMTVTNGDGTKNLFTQTSDVDLKKESLTFTFNFKADRFPRMKGTCSFTEAKSGNIASKVWESECSGGWTKYGNKPVLGGYLGTIFDICVMRNDKGEYRMYCSWRDKKSIAISESKDGLTWTVPVICLANVEKSTWEQEVNRPVVIQKDGLYHMWYTGQIGGGEGNSYIGYATSKDGIKWKRVSDKPVLSPELPWEKVALMCPHVIWDKQEHIFKMWFSGGEQWEPDAIGFATSTNGLNWKKFENNPVFHENKEIKWESKKVTACQVIKRQNDYLMYYIGFSNTEKGQIAQIGMAKSKDGISNWERFAENPIIKPGNGWDGTSCYKPFVVADPEHNRYFLYYNGRTEIQEQIGAAIHDGMDLGF
jgi:beta-1,2-mannobiose phosphorylase / 1,2-beta-oligomannan phosphorylase